MTPRYRNVVAVAGGKDREKRGMQRKGTKSLSGKHKKVLTFYCNNLNICQNMNMFKPSGLGENPDRRCSSQPEALGADQEVTNGLKHSKKRLLQGVSRPCGLQRAVNTEQAPKPSLRKPTRHNNGEGRRRRRRDGKCILRFRRGSGGSTYGTDLMCNKGSLPGCHKRQRQTREGQWRPRQMADGPVVP